MGVELSFAQWEETCSSVISFLNGGLIFTDFDVNVGNFLRKSLWRNWSGSLKGNYLRFTYDEVLLLKYSCYSVSPYLQIFHCCPLSVALWPLFFLQFLKIFIIGVCSKNHSSVQFENQQKPGNVKLGTFDNLNLGKIVPFASKFCILANFFLKRTRNGCFVRIESKNCFFS